MPRTDKRRTGIGRKLRELRKRAGLRQEDLAAQAKISERAIVQYEREDAQPGWRIVLDMCKALGARPNDLLPDSWPEERTSNDADDRS